MKLHIVPLITRHSLVPLPLPPNVTMVYINSYMQCGQDGNIYLMKSIIVYRNLRIIQILVFSRESEWHHPIRNRYVSLSYDK
jgi:hypothetical protein